MFFSGGNLNKKTLNYSNLDAKGSLRACGGALGLYIFVFLYGAPSCIQSHVKNFRAYHVTLTAVSCLKPPPGTSVYRPPSGGDSSYKDETLKFILSQCWTDFIHQDSNNNKEAYLLSLNNLKSLLNLYQAFRVPLWVPQVEGWSGTPLSSLY